MGRRDDSEYKVGRIEKGSRRSGASKIPAPTSTPKRPAGEQGGRVEKAAPVHQTAASSDQFRVSSKLENFIKRVVQKVDQDFSIKTPANAINPVLRKSYEAAISKAQLSASAPPSFLQKSAVQWKDFFKKFLHRTVRKQTSMENLSGMTLRGVVKIKGERSGALLIGDLKFSNGVTDKFARFQLASADSLMKFAELGPGSQLNQQDLMQSTDDGMLQYFAIDPPDINIRTIIATLAASSGIFTTQRTEEAVAKHLGIQLSSKKGKDSADEVAEETLENSEKNEEEFSLKIKISIGVALIALIWILLTFS